jgi:hypothetical protein
VALSVSSYGQSHARAGIPLVLLGTVQMSDRATEPIKIVSVVAWGADHMTLRESAYVTSTNPHGIGGGGGQLAGALTLSEAAKATREPGWSHLRPLVGATVGPCCRQQYYLALSFMPDVTHTTGRVRGVIIEYRTSNGQLYRTYANGLAAFCTEASSAARCKQADHLDTELMFRDIHSGPAPSALTERGTWHG